MFKSIARFIASQFKSAWQPEPFEVKIPKAKSKPKEKTPKAKPQVRNIKFAEQETVLFEKHINSAAKKNATKFAPAKPHKVFSTERFKNPYPNTKPAYFKDATSHVYLIESGNNDGIYKIGFTTRTRDARLNEVKTKYKVPNARVLADGLFKGEEAGKNYEQMLHQRYQIRRTKRARQYIGIEWFEFSEKEVDDLILLLNTIKNNYKNKEIKAEHRKFYS